MNVLEQIKELKEKCERSRDNYWNSMQKIDESILGYDLWDGSRMAYNVVIQDLEKIIKENS